MPEWMQQQEGIDWSALTISFVPPYYLKKVPGRHWLFSMTEGSRIPDDWVWTINNSGVERVLVPCKQNADAFVSSGVTAPVSVIPGGTDPDEFPAQKRIYQGGYSAVYPYTFLTLADRGFRKGWDEVREAFYVAFGGKTTGKRDVRLIIKARPKLGMTLLDWMASAQGADPRVVIDQSDVPDPYNIYIKADCVAMPSRSEGWGMPHREAAMCGLPVITQEYSGLDDAKNWSLVVEDGELVNVPREAATSIGQWRMVNIGELAERMLWCYDNPVQAQVFGWNARRWLVQHQTWRHAAEQLVYLIEGVDSGEEEECSGVRDRMER
jgi:glycosyltransferase involved in cell wall biosynthesis